MFTIVDDYGNVSIVEEPSPDVIHTYADYYSWKFEERVELFRGVVFPLLTPNTVHQLVLGNLFLALGNYLEKNKSKVFFAPFDIRLFAKAGQPDDEITTVVQPDICVISDQSKLDERGVLGAPDLMIEILLPGNSRKEVRLKYELYEEAGVKEYWIVSPSVEVICVYQLGDDGRFGGCKAYTSGDFIQVATVPGLTIDVSDIFDI
jgi:Uma2 family endonuclease